MDKFAQDAFKKAEQQRLDAEATAWCETPKGTKKDIITASLLVSFPDIVKLLESAMKNGLEDALHKYEEHLLMGGFSLGYKAGQKSMLEDGK